MSSQYRIEQYEPVTPLWITARAARESTQPITKSKLLVISSPLVTCFGTAFQSKPQNKFSLLTRTTDLNSPISLAEKGWRTQLVAEIRSPSNTGTASPDPCPYASSA